MYVLEVFVFIGPLADVKIRFGISLDFEMNVDGLDDEAVED